MVLLDLVNEQLSCLLLKTNSSAVCFSTEVSHHLAGRCASNGIVVHEVSQGIENVGLMLQDVCHVLIACVLSNHLLSLESKRRVKSLRKVPNRLLDLWS